MELPYKTPTTLSELLSLLRKIAQQCHTKLCQYEPITTKTNERYHKINHVFAEHLHEYTCGRETGMYWAHDPRAISKLVISLAKQLTQYKEYNLAIHLLDLTLNPKLLSGLYNHKAHRFFSRHTLADNIEQCRADIINMNAATTLTFKK